MTYSWSGAISGYHTALDVRSNCALLALLDAVGPATQGERLLDVGTGLGTVAAAAAERGYQAVGVDADRSLVNLARQLHPGIELVRAVLPHLPFPDGAFDVTTADLIVNHATDPESALIELHRVTTPGGTATFIISPMTLSPRSQTWDALENTADAQPPRQTMRAHLESNQAPRALSEISTRAGFNAVQMHELCWPAEIHLADLWAAVAGGVAAIKLTHQTQSTRHQPTLAHAQQRAREAPLTMSTTALLATAIRT